MRSGSLVADFPPAAGCRWPSINGVCVEVAGRFYLQLLGRLSGKCDDGAVASAFRTCRWHGRSLSTTEHSCSVAAASLVLTSSEREGLLTRRSQGSHPP